MPRRKKPLQENGSSSTPPVFSVEEREDQIIAKAYRLAEQQIMDGTATPSIIMHFLKLGSSNGKFEKQLLENQVALTSAKTEAIKAAKDLKVIYEDAMRALVDYRGGDDTNE